VDSGDLERIRVAAAIVFINEGPEVLKRLARGRSVPVPRMSEARRLAMVA
jgi:hypothetical protein